MAFPSTFMASGTVPQIRDTKRILWLKKLATIQGSQLAPFTNNNPAFSDTTWRLKAKAASAAMGRDIAETICCGSAPAPANDPVFDNLAHYWSADEASGNARADSKDSIDLLETGGVVNSAAGKEGNAANYNVAGHYLRMASQIGFGGIHAVSFWINIRTLPGVGDVVSLLSDGFGNDYCQLDHSGNVNFQDDLIGGGVDPVISQPLGSLNTWHFVVVGADPVAMVEYISVDGAAYTTADVSLGSTGTGFQSDDVFAFGSPPNAVPDGLFDEIAAWSPPLTQANVTTLWNSSNGTFWRP